RLRTFLPPTLAAFQHRNFRLYWFGAFFSLIGTWIQSIACGWLVLQLSNSAFIVGLNSTVAWLPAWFVSLPAGVLADHYNKRNLMIVTQTVLAVLALILAVLTWTGVVNITHILIISALAGFVVTVNSPVVQSMVPELVRGRDVLNAIALNSTMFNSARVVGPALAGVLIGIIGPAGCFGINSASFLAIIGALLLIRLDGPKPAKTGETVWQRMLSGLHLVRADSDILTLIIMMAVFSSFGIVYLPLMPVFARDVLGSGAGGYGLMMTALGIGAVAGGLTLATVSRTARRGRFLTIVTFLLSALLIIFSFVRDLRLALVVMVLMGFCQTTVASLTNTMIQLLVPDQMRGRVMSVYTLAFNGMFPVGSFFAGAVAQKLGAPAATLAGGSVVLASLITVSILRPQIRQL
ncbi:MFS transporter, partial [candidate division WOR-3 bacterium]|nr:MFS transporter [candidate division WOR-3 bacterium]